MNRQQFNDAMMQLSEPPDDTRPPFWDYWRHDLWMRGLSDDPREFEKWPCIYHTMLVNHWKPYIKLQYERIKHKPRLIAETHLPAYPLDRFEQTPYSLNLIHQAHHLAMLLDKTGTQIRRNKAIIEFGGGYGAMALLIRRLGMADNYYIIDLPEFALLQQFYLSQMGVSERVTWNDAPSRCDIFIAAFSLSEVPVVRRDDILDAHKARRYLFLYSDKFGGENNIAYFQRHLPAHMPEVHFEHVSCDDFLPPGSFYTIGWR